MSTFDLTHDLDPDDENVHSSTPSWVICVIRFKTISTFSRDKQGSISTDGSEAAAEKGPLIITNDCTQMVVNSNKRSHVGNLAATLKCIDINYLAEILPGDWLFAWITETEEHAADVIDKIKNSKAANGFNDGLKFVGRVYSVFETLTTDENGTKRAGVDLQGVSFNEFDTSVYYNPNLSVSQPYVNTWMGNMGIAIDKFLNKGEVDINGAIPELLELLFGRGISQKAANPAGEDSLQGVSGLTTGDGEAPFSYVVPTTVGNLLGKTSRSKSSGVLAYADIIQSVIGIQKYSNNAATGPNSSSSFDNQVAVFTPSQLKPLFGKFLAEVPVFSGTPMWNVLERYLNRAVNEMYTCLRVDEDGNVLPTFVCRQLPFTSSIMADDDRTGFLELPRWKVPASMISSYRIGRSDALRCNFVKMNVDAPTQAQPDIYSYQDVRSPPVRDDQDIRRSGLRLNIEIVKGGIKEQQEGAKDWYPLRSDILMGQHLTLGGTVNMFGIEAPICGGDNFEFKNTVFHIESVTHTAAVIDRHKKFMTTLQLSYGVRATENKQGFGDDKIYAVLQSKDFDEFKPGIAAAGQDVLEDTKTPEDSGDFFSTDGGGLA